MKKVLYRSMKKETGSKILDDAVKIMNFMRELWFATPKVRADHQEHCAEPTHDLRLHVDQVVASEIVAICELEGSRA